jgi:hypothetical protein
MHLQIEDWAAVPTNEEKALTMLGNICAVAPLFSPGTPTRFVLQGVGLLPITLNPTFISVFKHLPLSFHSRIECECERGTL